METRQRVHQLVEQVQKGQVLMAFEEFYADEVMMQENSNPATVGKEVNRHREEQFVGSIEEVHENRAASVIVDGDEAVIHWILDFTNQDGARLRMDQLAHQVWREGCKGSYPFPNHLANPETHLLP